MSEEPHDKMLPEGPDAEPRRAGLNKVTDGEWAGWYIYQPSDAFEDHTGPFYCRVEDQALVCGFRPGAKNCNAGGNVHGGSLMTFADYALFMIAGGMNNEIHGVTVTCNCEFVNAAVPGELLVARGEVVRAGLSMVFVRGIIYDADDAASSGMRPVLAFSGSIKRLTARER
jgi:uncharacterized protein (TIGR00369 family)